MLTKELRLTLIYGLTFFLLLAVTAFYYLAQLPAEPQSAPIPTPTNLNIGNLLGP